MSKIKQHTHGTARCSECIFGRGVTIVDKDKAGKVTGKREMCECHVDAKTGERTFAGLAPSAGANA